MRRPIVLVLLTALGMVLVFWAQHPQSPVLGALHGAEFAYQPAWATTLTRTAYLPLVTGRKLLLPPPGCMAGFGKAAIDVVPERPTQNDVVRIILGGSWSDTCVPRYGWHQRTGNVIRVDLVANYRNTACGFMERCWEVTVEVGLLPEGRYTVEAYIHVLWSDSEQVLPAGTGSFTVYPAYASRVP